MHTAPDILSMARTKRVRMKEPTTLKIEKTTHDRLKMLGHMGDTFDSLLNRMADCYEKEELKRKNGNK